MAYTQEQINQALAEELSLRPGTSYEDLLNYATSTYGLGEDQVNAAYLDYNRDQGMDDVAFNEWANDAGWTEQDVLDARDNWLDTADGQAWLQTLPELQQDWANTFWTGDMAGAQNVLDTNKLTPEILQNVYGISGNEIGAVADRYGVVPFGGAAPTKPPTNPTQQQQKNGFGMWSNTGGGPMLGGAGQRASFSYGQPTTEAGGWSNRFTTGAAGNETLGAGNAQYGSDLIKALRQGSADTLRSNNAGVSMVPGLTSRTPAVFNPGAGNAFVPPIFQQTTAPALSENEALGNQIGSVTVPQDGWSVDQASRALANELTLRPGSTYDALRVQALRYPGMDAGLFDQAYQNVVGSTPKGGTQTTSVYEQP